MTSSLADPARPGGGRTARTRRDLVQAAISCWSADSSASLGQVAQTAGVGRTTLNRYFTDRAELLAAVDAECRDRFLAAVVRARPADGTGREALQRLCVEIVELGELLGLIFADNAVVDPDTWGTDPVDGAASAAAAVEHEEGKDGEDDDNDGDPLGAAAVRGHADGSIDPTLPPAWVATLAWTSMFAAWLSISSGATTQHEAGQLLVRTLGRGIAG